MSEKRPISRKKHIVDGKGEVKRSGPALGTGPVGRTEEEKHVFDLFAKLKALFGGKK